ncbi:MAG: cell division protein FtsL [Methyloligellaceae bacterium]
MRFFSILLVSGLVALAVVIYEVKYETRSLDQRVAQLRLDLKEERDAIAVLRAEWSHLNRPERLARLARKHLGLKPLGGRQMVTAAQLGAVQAEPASDPDAMPRHGEGVEARRHPISATRQTH